MYFYSILDSKWLVHNSYICMLLYFYCIYVTFLIGCTLYAFFWVLVQKRTYRVAQKSKPLSNDKKSC